MHKISPMGVALRRLRLRLGISQETMAKRMDISVGALSGIESGKTRPTWVFAEAFWNAFCNDPDVSADDFADVRSAFVKMQPDHHGDFQLQPFTPDQRILAWKVAEQIYTLTSEECDKVLSALGVSIEVVKVDLGVVDISGHGDMS